MLRKMKRILKVMFKTRRTELTIAIPPSRDSPVNTVSFFLSKQIMAVKDHTWLRGNPGWLRVLSN